MPDERERILGRLSPAARRLVNQRLTKGTASPDLDGRTEGPLSYSQERVWTQYQLVNRPSQLHHHHLLRFGRGFEPKRLIQATKSLVTQHSIFRTIFRKQNGKLEQSVAIDSVPCSLEDWSGYAAGQLEPLLQDFFLRRFRLDREPLIRWRLLKCSDEQHLFQVVVHHIGSDRKSRVLFRKSLARLYQDPSYKPGFRQYLDLAAEEREAPPSETCFALPKWLHQEEPATIPPSFRRPLQLSEEGGKVDIAFGPSHNLRLPELRERQRVTSFTALLCSIYILLYKACGNPRVTVGNNASTRELLEAEGTQGCFVNPILLSSELSMDMSGVQLLKNVQRSSWEAFTRVQIPFQKLMGEFRPAREASEFFPWFRVIFDFYVEPDSLDLEIPGVEIETVELELEPVASSDIRFQVREHCGQLSGFIEYSCDLYSRNTVEQASRCFLTLFQQLCERPELAIRDYRLGPSEPSVVQKLQECTPIIPAFEAQVAAFPDALAVTDHKGELSYLELDQRANALAHRLLSSGVKQEDIVAIDLPRSRESVIAQLAVLKVGALFLCLEPSLPPRRRQAMIDDARPEYTIEASHLRGPGAAVVDSPRSPQQHSEGAYLIYSSGSTGKPRGVVGTQTGVVSRAGWMAENYPFRPGELVAHKTPLAFVDSIWEVFGPLLHGASLFIVEGRPSPLELLQTLCRAGVDRLVLVPTLLRVILQLPNLKSLASGISLWVSSGEELTPDLVRKFYERLPHSKLLNLYGSTEVGGDVMSYDTQYLDDSADRVPLGEPIGGNSIHILSPFQERLADGLVGEIAVSGPSPCPWLPPESDGFQGAIRDS